MSCLVVYVIVLQAFLIALSGARVGLADAAGDGLLAVELCRHGAGGAPALPDTHDKGHCALCTACAHHGFAPPAPVTPGPLAADARPVPWSSGDRLTVRPGVRLDHRPRGPPLAT